MTTANQDSSPSSTDITPITVLQEMKEVLFEEGWCQNDLENAAGNLCLVGAQSRARVKLSRDADWGRFREVVTATNEASGLIKQVLGLGRPSDVPMWNDDPDRTFDEVIGAIDQAIILGKEQGHNG